MESADDNTTYATTESGFSLGDLNAILAPILFLYKFYEVVGAVATAANLMMVLLLITSMKFLTRYPLFVALAAADLVNGVGFMMAGLARTSNLQRTDMFGYQKADCMKEVYPGLLVYGAQGPAFVTLILGVERVMAVFFPIWYKLNMVGNEKKIRRGKVFMVIISLLAPLTSVILGHALVLVLLEDQSSHRLCSTSSVWGIKYTLFHYFVVIVVSVVAFVLNSAAFIKSPKKVGVQLTIAAFSLLLIALPNFVLFGVAVDFWDLERDILGWLYMLFASNSVLNVVVCVAFVGNFRNRLIEVCTCGSYKEGLFGGKAAVLTINSAPNGEEHHANGVHPSGSNVISQSVNKLFAKH